MQMIPHRYTILLTAVPVRLKSSTVIPDAIRNFTADAVFIYFPLFSFPKWLD